MKHVRLVITGRVQRVRYRLWTVEEATARGLKGWVRNRLDGSVEAVLSGPEATVDEMIRECRMGPPAARVDNIAIVPTEEPTNEGFDYLPTEE